MLLGGLTAALGLSWWGTDRLAAATYHHWRPQLERLVTRVLGHPLQLGDYRGLRWLGIRAGATRLAAGVDNPSTIEAPAVSVAFDPLRSLWQRTWVLDLVIERPQVELRRNSRGLYWQLPQQPPGPQPPPLALRIRVPQPAALRLYPARGAALPLEVRGVLSLPLQRRQMSVQAIARSRRHGQLGVLADIHWPAQAWQLQLQPRALAIEPLLPLLPEGLQTQLQGRLQGRLDGQLLLARSQQRQRCQGQLRVGGLQWRLPALPEPLRSDGLDLRCSPQAIQLQPAALQLGSWSGRLAGRLRWPDALQLQLQARERRQGHQLQARLEGPLQQPRLSLSGSLEKLALAGLPPQPLQIRAQMDLRLGASSMVRLLSLQLRRADALLEARGELWPKLRLESQQLRLGQELTQRLAPLIGAAPQLQAVLQQIGSWAKPRLELVLQQQANPLLGNLQARLLWQPGLLQLQRFQSAQLQASGRLPLPLRSGALQPGDLQLQLDLQRFPLARLSRLIGSRLRGELEAWGEVRGPLQQLQPHLQLLVREPGVGPLWLPETWRGSLQALPQGRSALQLQALAPAAPGRLQAQLDPRWLPAQVLLQRGSGALRFSGDPRRYQWSAQAFPLAGLQLALGPRSLDQPLQGDLSGRGELELQPLWIRGAVALQRPQLLGVYGHRLDLSGQFHQGRYSLQGQWQAELPPATSLAPATIGMRLQGEQAGALWMRLEGRQLGTSSLQQLLAAWPRWRGDRQPAGGSAADLAGLVINTFGGSLSDQLLALQQAQLQLAEQRRERASRAPRFDPADLEGLFDADLTLRGLAPDRLHLDLQASGHLWLQHDDRDQALSATPLVVQLQGPIGSGRFSIQHLPLALLALFAPVPTGLSGGLAAKGRFALASGGRRPELDVALTLQDAALEGQALQLERGQLQLQEQALSLDWSLRSAGAANSVDLKGSIPLKPDQDGLELRLASRGDGVHFLSVLGGSGVQWQQGSADLQLLVRGSLAAPVANGFLRFREGVLEVAGQTMRELDATVLFDFQELELQQLTARVGEQGTITGGGQLGLLRPIAQPNQPLQLQLSKVPFRVPRLQAQADGQVLVAGSLRRLDLGGELQISRGRINAQPGQLATEDEPSKPVTVPQLVESRWDFRQPLLVMGQQMESSTSKDLRAAMPNLPFIQFEGLRLRFGPQLRVTVPAVLNFDTAGLLTLNGPLDPSLRANGVLRLLNGRLSLFTTNFSLDPDAPNVAVFTNSLGLIPYVDIALRTRVSDTLPIDDRSRNNPLEWNGFSNGTGSFSSVDQLRLVKVRLQAAGPADQLTNNIRLTSAPPLPEERLVALIGGNSLVGLVGGNAGAALATVLGQSLLAPIVGGLSDAFGQRLSFSLYPSYFVPAEVLAKEQRSRRLPSELVLGSEIGLDVTERFNFSVLAAPNRSDIPPQMTLRYQANDRLGVQTSIDTEGRWQSQLQLFFRF